MVLTRTLQEAWSHEEFFFYVRPTSTASISFFVAGVLLTLTLLPAHFITHNWERLNQFFLAQGHEPCLLSFGWQYLVCTIAFRDTPVQLLFLTDTWNATNREDSSGRFGTKVI